MLGDDTLKTARLVTESGAEAQPLFEYGQVQIARHMSQPRKATQLKYMAQLDGLRALSVLAVIYTHYLWDTKYWLFGVHWGGLGVRCFFVISGFIITSILLQKTERFNQLYSCVFHFYAKRFWRLAPPLFIMIALAWEFDVGTARTTWLWHVTYLSNVRFYLVDKFEPPFFHLWSLAIEEQFYVFWPFFLLLVPRQRLISALIMLVITTILIRVVWRYSGGGSLGEGVLPFQATDALGLGALLAVLGPESSATKHLARILGLIGLGLFVSSWLFNEIDPYRNFQLVGSALIFFWLVRGAAVGFNFPGTLLGSSPLVYIGQISYGIYVYHLLVPNLLWRFALPSMLGLPLAACLTVAAAAVSWHLVEKPLRALAHRRRNANQNAAQAG